MNGAEDRDCGGTWHNGYVLIHFGDTHNSHWNIYASMQTSRVFDVCTIFVAVDDAFEMRWTRKLCDDMRVCVCVVWLEWQRLLNRWNYFHWDSFILSPFAIRLIGMYFHYCLDSRRNDKTMFKTSLSSLSFCFDVSALVAMRMIMIKIIII